VLLHAEHEAQHNRRRVVREIKASFDRHRPGPVRLVRDKARFGSQLLAFDASGSGTPYYLWRRRRGQMQRLDRCRAVPHPCRLLYYLGRPRRGHQSAATVHGPPDEEDGDPDPDARAFRAGVPISLCLSARSLPARSLDTRPCITANSAEVLARLQAKGARPMTTQPRDRNSRRSSVSPAAATAPLVRALANLLLADLRRRPPTEGRDGPEAEQPADRTQGPTAMMSRTDTPEDRTIVGDSLPERTNAPPAASRATPGEA
jgi:hypothetical protein